MDFRSLCVRGIAISCAVVSFCCPVSALDAKEKQPEAEITIVNLKQLSGVLAREEKEVALQEVERIIPLVFKDASAREVYFYSAGNLFVAEEPLTKHIYGDDLRQFASVLVESANRGVKKKNYEYASRALALAIDITSLPTHLIPEENLKFEGKTAVSISFLGSSVFPAAATLVNVRRTLRDVSAQSEGNRVALKEALLFLEEMRVAQEKFRQQLKALPETKFASVDNPAYQEIHREWTKKWQRDLPALKAKINQGMKQIFAAKDDNLQAPAVVGNNK